MCKGFLTSWSLTCKCKLIANEMTTDMIREKIGADSLTYGEHHMWHGILGDECCYRCEKRNTV